MTGDDDSECRHGQIHDGEIHPCPFQEDVHNDSTPVCDCCPECQRDCADDI